VDSEPIVYLGLEAVLRRATDIHRVGLTRDGKSAMERLSSTPPDVVVIDPHSPHENGVALIRAMGNGSRATQVLVFSRDFSPETVRAVFAAGASGYASKDGDPALLPGIIRTVARGQPSLCPAVAAMLVAEAPAPGTAGRARDLTPREIWVLQHVVQGRTSKEIASALGVSKRTIDAHRAAIMAKLGLHTVPEFVLYAVTARLAPPGLFRIPT
jgi:DNA-binding NarL/FixJ family response regulator